MSAPTGYTEDDMLPISGLADVVFCPRRAALHHLEGAWEDNLWTAEGSLVHERAHEGPRREVRGDVVMVRGLRVRSLRLGLTGICDVVEFHRAAEGGISLPDRPGGWSPFPIEYKRGRLRYEPSYRVQLCAQALCLEEMLGVPVPAGALFYARTGRHDTLQLDDALRADTEAAAAQFHGPMAASLTPSPEPGPRCEQCSIEPLCLPRAVGQPGRVGRYLAAACLQERQPPP